ncbi:MAG: SPOR domain-containing protein [Proteobacteria bacterium]|nr:SPOR domain-containing protein [Pseudomonadota bacterium]
MPRSSIERGLILSYLFLSALDAGAARAQLVPTGPLKLFDVIAVTERDEQVDIAILFNCSMRFINSIPASEGKQVRIQMAPLGDCRVGPMTQISPELPAVSGGANIIAAARAESLAPGQITLTLDFRRNERFVVAQGIDPRGLGMRLLDHGHGRARISVGEGADSVSNFAINLESQPKPFPPEAIELARSRLKAPVFVSETTVEGEKWYRLRVGPIVRRSEADRMLATALRDYPRAWLAIGDDQLTTDINAPAGAVTPAVEKMGSDPPLPPDQLKRLLGQARAAMSARDYPTAIAVLTQLQRQPEFPDRATAQELLGLSRERSGQLAHAKAEYEEYLRRYPNGEAAGRVAYRLKILRAAEAKARTGRDAKDVRLGWELHGGFSQTARYDGSRQSNGGLPTNTPVPPAEPINENALFTDADLLARRRGESNDWVARLSAGYDKTFGQDVSGYNPTRVSLASVEVLDRPLGVLARAGRQAYNADGILGTFDGMFVSWQFKPSWTLNAAAGFPVEQFNLSPQTQERFQILALGYTPPGAHWDASVFAALQQFGGLTDRQAIGGSLRYLATNMSLVSVVDYDTFYRSLNTASLLGTMQLPARWSLSIDAERRNSPVLQTRNALIGQPFTDLKQLEQVATDDEIYQWARDRTPVTQTYSLTATKPLGTRLVFSAIVTAGSTGATPASGGVAAVPATGTLMTYQGQLYASSLWRAGDFHVLTLTHSDTEIGRVDSISTNSRFPLSGSWRIGPRFAVDRLSGLADGGKSTTYIPSVLLEYQRNNKLLQLDVGGELGQREALLQLQSGAFVQTQNTTRYYASMSYRIDF